LFFSLLPRTRRSPLFPYPTVVRSQALESDDTDNLPQPVYTAGYIRNYARLVALSADSMVADYVKQETKDLPSLPPSTRVDSLPERYRQVAEALPRSFSIAAANARNATPVQYAAIAIGVVLAILIGWQSSRIYQDAPEIQQAQSQDSIIVINKGQANKGKGPESNTSSSASNTSSSESNSGLCNPLVIQDVQPTNIATEENAVPLIRKEKSESVAEQIEMAETIGISMNDSPS